MKNTKLYISIAAATLLSACASVPLESEQASNTAKQFAAPSNGKAGIYIYRTLGIGSALEKDLWIDDKCVGESAPNVFFYKEVPAGKEYKISTESEFSPNDLMLKTESGKSYFIEQYIKMGLFVGGADLELMSDREGKEDISDEDVKLAVQGTCSN